MIMCWRPVRLLGAREFVELAFAQIGHRIEWRGRGVDEEGIDAHGGDVPVAVIRGISGRLSSISCSAICLRCSSVGVGVTRSNSPTWRVRWSRALPLC